MQKQTSKRKHDQIHKNPTRKYEYFANVVTNQATLDMTTGNVWVGEWGEEVQPTPMTILTVKGFFEFVTNIQKFHLIHNFFLKKLFLFFTFLVLFLNTKFLGMKENALAKRNKKQK